MALSVIDFFEIGIVGYGLDPLLQRDHLIVTGHYHNGAEFQALGQMHGADGSAAAEGFHVVVEDLERKRGSVGGGTRAAKFSGGADEDADFARLDAFFGLRAEPIGDGFPFDGGSIEHQDFRRRSVENRNGTAAFFGVAINVGDFDTQQSVG